MTAADFASRTPVVGDTFVCGTPAPGDTLGDRSCVRDVHPTDEGHRDADGGEWLTVAPPARSHADQIAATRPAVPYVSLPLAGPGLPVTVRGDRVWIAGQAYTRAAALELSVAIARAATPPQTTSPRRATMPETHPVGTEVTITLTGRVIGGAAGTSVVVEYVRDNGFASHQLIHTDSPAVTVCDAGPPDTEKLALRARAARLVATSCLDPDSERRAHREWVERWNDAYPLGTPVRYAAGSTSKESRTTTPARMWADVLAVVEVEAKDGPISLNAVVPIAEAVASRG